jgi:hypothetical protein
MHRAEYRFSSSPFEGSETLSAIAPGIGESEDFRIEAALY